MKFYQLFLCMWLCCGVASETNGFNFQQPSTKWAFAHSYSWVYSDGNNFNTPTQQPEEQALQRLQQQVLQQQALQQQALQQQALQQQALQQQAFKQQAIQQQALQQQALQQQALQHQALQQQELQQKELQQQALQQIQPQVAARLQMEKHALPSNRLNSQSNLMRDYVTPNEPHRRALNSLQSENMRTNDLNTQEFIDKIVRKVIQETRGEFALPTTREDIEKIVRKILFENSSDTNEHLASNQISGYRGNGYVSNQKQSDHEMNTNRNSNGLPLNTQNANSFTYPITPTERLNPQAECLFNCRSSRRDGQPIAVASANSFYPLNRSADPRMLANSFTYTSV